MHKIRAIERDRTRRRPADGNRSEVWSTGSDVFFSMLKSAGAALENTSTLRGKTQVVGSPLRRRRRRRRRRSDPGETRTLELCSRLKVVNYRCTFTSSAAGRMDETASAGRSYSKCQHLQPVRMCHWACRGEEEGGMGGWGGGVQQISAAADRCSNMKTQCFPQLTISSPLIDC